MATRYVFIHPPGQTQAVPAGRLELIQSDGELVTSRFQYGRRYLERLEAMDVDPVSLPTAEERETPREPVNNLVMFGAIRDAAPDAWGRRVIENRLQRSGPLAEVDYLDHAGSDRAGALDIRTSPDSPPRSSTLPTHIELPYLLEAADRIETGEPVPARLQPYFQGGPTLGGMRPKAVVLVDGREFVAKFPSPRDQRFNVPVVERSTLELARAAGLDVPETRIVDLDNGRKVMLIERFDREPGANGLTRRHMVSALTMLGVDEMDSPRMGYGQIADVISRRGPARFVRTDRLELFGRMVFNILVSNDDDHLRNHAFLFDYRAGGWRLSPLYDVVPSPQVGTERFLNLEVGPQGRAARLDNALEGAGRFGLLRREAVEVIERIVSAVRPWREVFDQLGVSGQDADAVASAFRRASAIGMRQMDRG